MDVRKLQPEQRKTIADAIILYSSGLRDVVLKGDLYRLESPYDGPRSALKLRLH